MVTSIFYNQSEWHKLIGNFIKPFINHEQGSILSWHIYLSTNRGDHVILVFNLLDNCDAEGFKARFSTEVASYLSENASTTKKTEYALHGFFMDFPNNSVEFEIEKPSLYQTFNKTLNPISNHLSEILTEVLSDQEIDTELLYTFIIYLQFGIIKAAYPNIKQARKITLKLTAYFEGQVIAKENDSETIFSEEHREDFRQLFNENREILQEVIEDIWSPETYIDELLWIKNWEDSCKVFLLENDFQSSYIILIEIIYKHMGMKGRNIANLLTKHTLTFFNETIKNGPIIRIA